MFGGMGDIAKMMKMASEMKSKLPEMKQRLAEQEYTAESGDGAVRATVNGKFQIVELDISPDALQDAAMLSDLIKAAVSTAQGKAAEEAKAAMEEITGGMDLGGLADLM